MDKANIEKYILEFIPKYRELYLKEAEKLPYHINLLEEIKVSENAHSRILTKLLQQKTTFGKFEIVESFIWYIKEKAKLKSTSYEFENIHIKNPYISHGKGFIDLWIRDNNDYAIIVENKINDAPDMEKQLFRYIKTTEEDGFDRKNIYVIYLSSTYDNPPKEHTWGEGKENCKEEFKNRFLHLSFREDILTWLTDYVLPNVRLKDRYLSSALEQYIDHLRGYYNLRDINKNMNMKLQELIKKELELSDDNPQGNLSKLEEKKTVVINISNQIDALINHEKFRLWKEKIPKWKDALKKDYPRYDPSKNEWPGVYIPGEEIPILNDASKKILVELWSMVCSKMF